MMVDKDLATSIDKEMGKIYKEVWSSYETIISKQELKSEYRRLQEIVENQCEEVNTNCDLCSFFNLENACYFSAAEQKWNSIKEETHEI